MTLADYILKHTGKQIDLAVDKALLIDDTINNVIGNTVFKPSVNTFSEVENLYPNPQQNWCVFVNSENTLYQFNNNQWIPHSIAHLKEATSSKEGLMSVTDKNKLDAIDSSLLNIKVNDLSNPNRTLVTEDVINQKISLLGGKVYIGSTQPDSSVPEGFVWLEEI